MQIRAAGVLKDKCGCLKRRSRQAYWKWRKNHPFAPQLISVVATAEAAPVARSRVSCVKAPSFPTRRASEMSIQLRRATTVAVGLVLGALAQDGEAPVIFSNRGLIQDWSTEGFSLTAYTSEGFDDT